jgi:UDP-N-acetylglucosamine diphosphorylase / glucose-1-phosphate thymidylyltransferase / UDP-N-acetylgalactosamine diphosphorylase / glucosamine-1-phosphate N-acetyltransferase / galactosamine-1-phosphate N-acetyltransferase
MKILIFEDEKVKNLYPLTYLRPTWELLCGTGTLLDKVKRHFPNNEIHFWCRPELAPVLNRKYGKPVNGGIKSILGRESVMLINGRWLMGPGEFLPGKAEEQGICEGTLLYGHLAPEKIQPRDDLTSLLDKAACLPKKEMKARLINNLWDPVKHNAEAIKEDFELAGKKGILGAMAPESAVYGPKDNIYVAEGAEIHPMVVLDTRGGPVIIAEGVTVFPFTRIEGPAYIGPNCQIFGGKIREGCSFGPECRINGEVEESIIQGYSNKYHDGFLGHAHVGEWVNLGALTTDSDLKNDYSTVSVKTGGALQDTGEMKVGSFIGDHTKTSIGTMLNTGTVIGIMCNVLGVGALPPKELPSFTWFVKGKLKEAGVENQLQVARAAMARRKQKLSAEEEALVGKVYEMTGEQRRESIRKYR